MVMKRKGDTFNSEKVLWIVLASSIKAEIYRCKNKAISLFHTLTHDKSRLKSSELGTSGPGKYKTDISGFGNFAPHSDPHKEEHHHFAKELASFLETHKQKNDYAELIICAEPHFHGLLNAAMPKTVSSVIIESINKDYIPLPHHETIVEGIHDALFQKPD